MANRILTYRNRVNGEIGVYPEALAKHFDYLEEVDEDAKPLAYVPIPQDAIDALLGRNPEAVLDPDEEPEDFEPIFDAVADAEDFTPDDQPESGEEGSN